MEKTAKVRTNVSMPKPIYDKIVENKSPKETVSECVCRMILDYICDHDYDFFRNNFSTLKDSKKEGK